MSADTAAVVVVGAGHAGAEAATAVRQAGHVGRIVLVGDEPRLPYHRPPLSKAYLAGTTTLEALLLKQQTVYDKAEVELRTGVKVERIERENKRMVLSDRTTLAYSRAILATGSRPRPLLAVGLDAGNIPSNLCYLRTTDDVERMRGRFVEGARLLIIGAGYIGLEVAAVARKAGLHVTVLEAQPRVLARVAAPSVSAFFESLHREAGVDIRVGANIESITLNAAGDVEAVITNDGTQIEADLVLAGIGVIPNVELASGAGLVVDNGIVVNQFTQSSDPDILAIGDCSNHPNPIYGRRIRLESVPNALEQARIAAAFICGKPQAYASVPWFWSDQYDVKLQMAGLSQGYDLAITRGSPASKSFTTFYLQNGIVISADCVNRAPEFMLVKKLVASRRPIDPALLADESVTLKSLAEAAAV
ncbi:NAD(P)/FAD-dependent oxidoreductase [Noviherbaspirillum saxi]|uniref:Pyridine nucleotide-disulfide oxidoreductase n=1 Tax=Noviherbaspirillum saxi TaxID=2320863 RepID=A0A3A3FEM9_9BURK|nr:FAD-dependent oxidoreductase [Noviherbaspirillum saxi]RJF91700.1 pyridine nucleotide-disulfide oxidoreductase [Noviherbaspirillum saxi]